MSYGKLTLNLRQTEYEIIHRVGHEFRWNIIDQEDEENPEEEWDILWTDFPPPNQLMKKLTPAKRVSNFPGIWAIARKNNLCKNLNAIRNIFPVEYAFFPATWWLPQEIKLFQRQFSNVINKTFIIKPDASSQGRGIFLTRQFYPVQNMNHCIAQRYIARPRLLDGLKFDFRVYALITGWTPLRIFVYNEGLARFATEEYQTPLKRNINNLSIHLTNYALNKKSEAFDQDETVGHKRRMTTVLDQLEQEGENTTAILAGIDDIIIKTLAMVHPNLVHSYKTVQPLDLSNSIFFHILGFDIMLDHKCKPQLLEVNQWPSFATETPLDRDIKYNLIKDTFSLINLPGRDHSYNFRDFNYNGSKQQRKAKAMEIQTKRNKLEQQHKGNFRKIYPVPGYEKFFAAAHDLWQGKIYQVPRMRADKSHSDLKPQVAPPSRRDATRDATTSLPSARGV